MAFLCVASLIAAFSSLLLHAGAPPDALWGKALEVAATNAGWLPGLTIMRSDVLFKSERVAVHELWQRSSIGTNGKVETEIVKVLEDGKDVTQEEKKEKKKTKPKQSEKGDSAKEAWREGLNPFAQAVQPRISLKVQPHSRSIEGHPCVGYAFEFKNTNGGVAKGVAWLNAASGVPLEIQDMKLQPLPDKHLKSLTFTTRYEQTNGVWRAKSIETTGTVGVLFLKAGIRSTTTFSEHWKLPPATNEMARP